MAPPPGSRKGYDPPPQMQMIFSVITGFPLRVATPAVSIPGIQDLVPGIRDMRQRTMYMVPGGQVVDSVAKSIRATSELQKERERLERLGLPNRESAAEREIKIDESTKMRARAEGSKWASEMLGEYLSP
eukprot:5294807-Pyramimonas_sp.AAC.1